MTAVEVPVPADAVAGATPAAVVDDDAVVEVVVVGAAVVVVVVVASCGPCGVQAPGDHDGFASGA